MKITLNGQEKVIKNVENVNDLVTSLKIDIKKIAIEKNMEIVPRSSFKKESIKEGDEIEIIHFIGGG